VTEGVGRGPAPTASRVGVQLGRWLLAACVAVFAGVAVDVTHRGPLARADEHIAHWCFRHVTGRLHAACSWATHLGDSLLLAAFVVIVIAWLLTRRRRFDAVLLMVSAGATAAFTAGLKVAFHRSRPVYVDPVHGPKSFSFPSGHASGAFAVYLLLAILLTLGLSGRVRSWAIGGAFALATLVAATRVLLPVHFLSDVVAGSAIGLAVVAAAIVARRSYVHRS
jgi:membrane-associated phospholipid phosphatase